MTDTPPDTTVVDTATDEYADFTATPLEQVPQNTSTPKISDRERALQSAKGTPVQVKAGPAAPARAPAEPIQFPTPTSASTSDVEGSGPGAESDEAPAKFQSMCDTCDICTGWEDTSKGSSSSPAQDTADEDSDSDSVLDKRTRCGMCGCRLVAHLADEGNPRYQVPSDPLADLDEDEDDKYYEWTDGDTDDDDVY